MIPRQKDLILTKALFTYVDCHWNTLGWGRATRTSPGRRTPRTTTACWWYRTYSSVTRGPTPVWSGEGSTPTTRTSSCPSTVGQRIPVMFLKNSQSIRQLLYRCTVLYNFFYKSYVEFQLSPTSCTPCGTWWWMRTVRWPWGVRPWGDPSLPSRGIRTVSRFFRFQGK